MPTYNNDFRVSGSKVVYLKSGTGSWWVHRQYTYPRCNGVVHTFTGPNDGKFIPGIVRINEMTATRTTQSLDTGRWELTYGNGNSHCAVEGTVCGNPSWRVATLKGAGSSYDPALVGRAVQRAHAAIVDSTWDGGEFLAELPETLGLLRTGIGGLLKVISRAQRGGFTWSRADRARRMLLSGRSIKSLPRKVANAWLTWRYGIRPIIWDALAIIEIANGLAMKSDFGGLQRRRGRVRISTNAQQGYEVNTNGVYLYGDVKEFAEFERKVEATVYFKYGDSYGDLDAILMRYGLNPNQLPSLLWALVPLSFMLDWFVDVGTWVKAIVPKWKTEILGCSCSQKTTVRGSRISVPISKPAGFPTQGSPLHDTLVIERIVRRPQTLRGELPRLKPEIVLAIQQQADLISVLLQKALNKRRR